MMVAALSAYQMPATSFYVELVTMLEGLPCWLSRKESACNAGDVGFNPWVGNIPWRRNGNPLQYSCLGNPMDRGAWQATIGSKKSQTRLSD